MLETLELKVKTRGNGQIVNLTEEVVDLVRGSKIKDGAVILFNIGSTAALTTLEYEPGLVNHDMAAAFERIAPQGEVYQHEQTWHDDNGHSHVRAALLGPSLAVPLVEGKLTLGTWQQIVLVDFDTRGRDRRIVCQFIGE